MGFSFEKTVLRLLFCLQYLCPPFLGPYGFYFLFILYYSTASVQNLYWYEIICYSLSEFVRSCLQHWLGEGAGELLARQDSTLEVGLKNSSWPCGVGGGGVRWLSLCCTCALVAAESSSCWSCVLGGTAEEMMPWRAAVEPLLRQFITNLEILTFNVQLLLFLVSEQQSELTS